MTSKEMTERRIALNELTARFRPIWDTAVLSDVKCHAIDDMLDAGFDDETAQELVELAIDITRE